MASHVVFSFALETSKALSMMNASGESGVYNAHGADNGRMLDQLIEGRYDELARRARALLRAERINHTLQTSALVHEAYLRMINLCKIEWQDNHHFLSVAACVMRRVLVDHARSCNAFKRGGDLQRVDLNDNVLSGEVVTDILELDAALTRLATRDAVQAKIVEHRFFGGLSIKQTSSLLGLSPATVKRKWTMAQAWLYRELRGELSEIDR